MQQLYVHLGGQGGGVELLNHLHRGSGVTGKGEEDLGNGMKASYLYEFGLKTESNATLPTASLMWV